MPTTARRTAPDPSDGWTMPAGKDAVPAKNVAKLVATPTTVATIQMTSALAHSSRVRVGTAANVVAMVPVAYSPVAAMAPKAHMATWPNRTPPIMSNRTRAAPEPGLTWWSPMSPMPSISAIAATSDHSEARTVRILIHSKWTASTNVVLWTGPRTDRRALVISGGLSSVGGCAVFDGVGSQFHECGFQR